jgi:hypothetical protein
MSGYRQTLPLPPNVIDELKRAGIDISEWLTSLSGFGAQPFPVMVVRVRGKEEFGVAGLLFDPTCIIQLLCLSFSFLRAAEGWTTTTAPPEAEYSLE